MDCRIKSGNDELVRENEHMLSLVTPGLDPGVHPTVQYVMAGWVYMMASAPRGTLYIGVTNDLVRRVHQHREGAEAGFTRRYGIKRLVWFERHETMPLAIQRERTMKHWPRRWKIDLIVEINPEWEDLWDQIAT